MGVYVTGRPDSSPSARDTSHAVGFVLWRVVNRYIREVDRALAASGVGLTHLQFETLIQAAWLGRSGDGPTQAELSRFGGIQPMQVSHMLKTLEAKGRAARPTSARSASR